MGVRTVTFRLEGGRYVFATSDREVWIVSQHKQEAAELFTRVVRAFAEKGVRFYIEAYEDLGPWRRTLREAGATSRLRLGKTPPPLDRVRWQMPGAPVADAPPPVFQSWEDYMARTTLQQRMPRCYAASKKANRKRLISGAPFTRITAADVWLVIEAARGRCIHCGSLAVESRPSKANGAPAPWAQVGRRIGSLEHLKARVIGGDNFKENLAWACLWCNTWPNERRRAAEDHGGFYPDDAVQDSLTIAGHVVGDA